MSENFNIPIMKVAIAVFIVAALCGGALTKKHKQSLSSLLAHHTKHKHHKKHVLAIDGEGSDLLPGSAIGIGGIGVVPGGGGEAVEDPKVQELLDNQRIMLEKLDIIERKILQNPGGDNSGSPDGGDPDIIYPGGDNSGSPDGSVGGDPDIIYPDSGSSSGGPSGGGPSGGGSSGGGSSGDGSSGGGPSGGGSSGDGSSSGGSSGGGSSGDGSSSGGSSGSGSSGDGSSGGGPSGGGSSGGRPGQGSGGGFNPGNGGSSGAGGGGEGSVDPLDCPDKCPELLCEVWQQSSDECCPSCADEGTPGPMDPPVECDGEFCGEVIPTDSVDYKER